MRVLALALLLLAAGASAAEAPVAVRRLALLVGVNDGGPGRPRLRYAASDAQAFARVLRELGGVAPSDASLVLDVGRARLLEALSSLRTRMEAVRASGAARVEVLVYYSGHSDEEGLLLQGERLDYGELRRALASLPADVRITVLDSCASGAFARRKGGSARPAFLVDSGNQVRGHAILTSSSADEASQESDRLGGSFFTHHLVSGLRGAADSTRDGRVTLTEAYQFAFHETLARTERTQGGAQHPAYDIELAGTGDLVMTDLRSTSARLALAETLEGRLFVRDEGGTLVLELRKVAGHPTELGLSPGRYRVRREQAGDVSEATFVLSEGRATTLSASDFASLTAEATVLRGGSPDAPVAPSLTPEALPAEAVPAAPVPAPVPVPPVPERRRLVVNVGVVPGLSSNALLADGAPVENRLALGLVNDGAALGGGAALALVMNQYQAEARGAQVASVANVAGEVGGLQLALGLNVAHGQMGGLQGSMGVNYAGGDVGGLGQLALGVNVARGQVGGVQGALGLNVATGDVRGLQAALGVNSVGGDFRGVQTAVVVNSVQGEAWGLQGALGLNRADTFNGLQFALLNVGGDVTGAQVGLINVARKVKGLQLGLINAAQEVDGLPLGLLTFEQKGQLHLESWASDIQLANLGVKFGGKYVYTTLMAGIGPDDRLQRFTLGVGLGGHIPLGARFWLDVDGSAHSVQPVRDPFSYSNLLLQGRAMVGFQLARRLALFAGPTFNTYFLMYGADRRPLTTLPLLHREALRFTDDDSVHYWPGVQLGVRI